MQATSDRHFNQVDALRCFAMTGVIAQHCGLLPCGWIGVWLFYVVSGFVVTTSLLRKDDAGTPQTGQMQTGQIQQFYLRRAARIWPIYIGYTLAAFLISGLINGAPEWRPFLSLLFFYNNFEAAFGDGFFKHLNVGHLWTISVEMQFYLLYGFAFIILPRRRLVLVLAALLLVAPLLRGLLGGALDAHGMKPEDTAYAVYSFSVLHFDSFAMGSLLALCGPQLLQAMPARRLLQVGTGALALYALSYMLVNYAVRGDRGVEILRNVISGILFGQGREIFVYSAVALFSAGLIATAVTTRMPWTPILESRALQAIGKVSYGGYVYHQIAILFSVQSLHALTDLPFQGPDASIGAKLLKFALAYGLTLAFAFLSYSYIERPIIAAAGKRLRLRGDRKAVVSA